MGRLGLTDSQTLGGKPCRGSRRDINQLAKGAIPDRLTGRSLSSIMTHFDMIFSHIYAFKRWYGGFRLGGGVEPSGLPIPLECGVKSYFEGGCLSYYSIIYYDAYYVDI